jgi:hypothetical protein
MALELLESMLLAQGGLLEQPEVISAAMTLLRRVSTIYNGDISLEKFLQYLQESSQAKANVGIVEIPADQADAATKVIFSVITHISESSGISLPDKELSINEILELMQTEEFANLKTIKLDEFIRTVNIRITQQKVSQENKLPETEPLESFEIQFFDELHSININGIAYSFGSDNPYRLFKLLYENIGNWIGRDEATRQVYNLITEGPTRQKIGPTIGSLKRSLAKISTDIGVNFILNTHTDEEGTERLRLAISEETPES